MQRDLTAAQTKQAWQDYYSNIRDANNSEEFEAEFSKYVGTHTWHNAVRIVCESIHISDDARILDAGCGWGRMLLGVTDAFEGLNVTAIDQSDDAIALGKRVVGTDRNGNVIEWMQGDLQRLPFEDETFDGVFSMRVFQHLNDPHQGMSEIVRSLKPGGKFSIVVQNKLCPLNLTYYSRLYSPSEVKGWADGLKLADLNVTTMDFYPSSLGIPKTLSKRMNIERSLGRLPPLNLFGGKVVLTGTK